MKEQEKTETDFKRRRNRKTVEERASKCKIELRRLKGKEQKKDKEKQTVRTQGKDES